MRTGLLLLLLSSAAGCAQSDAVKTAVTISQRAAEARTGSAPPYVLTLEGVRTPEDRGIELTIYGEAPGKGAIVIGTAATMGWRGGPAEGPPRTIVIALNRDAARFVQGKRETQFWVVAEKARIRIAKATLDISR